MRWETNQASSNPLLAERKANSAVRPSSLIVRLLPPGFAVLLLVIFAGISPHISAQSKSPGPSPTPSPKQNEQEIDPDDVISVNTTEILLPVTVRNSAGLLVSNLTRKDFRIFEDGVERFGGVPLSPGLVTAAFQH